MRETEKRLILITMRERVWRERESNFGTGLMLISQQDKEPIGEGCGVTHASHSGPGPCPYLALAQAAPARAQRSGKVNHCQFVWN